MPQQIFYFNKLNSWDKITTICYVVLTAFLMYFFLSINSGRSNRTLLLAYALGTQFFLYLLNYKSLRNLTVYLVWILFSLCHLYFYYQLKDDPSLLNVRGHAASGLRNTIILLSLFQVLRFISIRTQRQELVAPTRGGQTDIFDGRRLTFIDYTLFVVYFGVTNFLNT